MDNQKKIDLDETKLAVTKATFASLEALFPLTDAEYEDLCRIHLVILTLKTVIQYRKLHAVTDTI